MTVLNFAYGSNLLTRRILARAPSTKVVGVGTVHGHALRWHMASEDGSGKCDMVPVNDPASFVIGVVYEVTRAEKVNLDRAETLGYGYEECMVQVQMRERQGGADAAVPDGAQRTAQDGAQPGERRTLTAVAYRALIIDPSGVPYDWYKALVVGGAREHGFPQPYIDGLEAVVTKTDADAARAARHRALVDGR